MKVIVEVELDDTWASPEEFETMSDNEVVDLIWEDIGAFLSGAKWEIIRNGT